MGVYCYADDISLLSPTQPLYVMAFAFQGYFVIIVKTFLNRITCLRLFLNVYFTHIRGPDYI